MDTLYTFPPLRRHIKLYSKMRAGDMSSESEDEKQTKATGRKTYIVKPKLCYDENISRLNQMIDRVYELRIRPTLGKRGKQPSLRIYSDTRRSAKRVVKGLPSNCYSKSWWRSRPLAERQTMGAVAEIYDFSIPDDLLDPDVDIPLA